MKIDFEDKSYIEISKSNTPNKIFVTIAAKSFQNTKELIVNSVELTIEQILSLVKSIQ